MQNKIFVKTAFIECDFRLSVSTVFDLHILREHVIGVFQEGPADDGFTAGDLRNEDTAHMNGTSDSDGNDNGDVDLLNNTKKTSKKRIKSPNDDSSSISVSVEVDEDGVQKQQASDAKTKKSRTKKSAKRNKD